MEKEKKERKRKQNLKFKDLKKKWKKSNWMEKMFEKIQKSNNKIENEVNVEAVGKLYVIPSDYG